MALNGDVYRALRRRLVEPGVDQVALFLVDGKAATAAVGTRRWDVLLRDWPHALVGVYDKRCCRQWVEEDLAVMEAV